MFQVGLKQGACEEVLLVGIYHSGVTSAAR
jgi:hypothetical protein